MLQKKSLIAVLVYLAIVVVTSSTIIIAGEPPKIDSTTPVEELNDLAAKGNADAMLELGERMIQGQGIDTNYAKGQEWIQKAADAGKTEAWYDLGVMYSNGMGVELNIPESMKYYKKGAELGDADCQTSMGMLYQAGEDIPGGVKADPTEAAKWYRMAAEQNHQEAIFHLAQLYLWGQGVPADSVEAAKWFRKAAEDGNPDAQWMLGVCYRKGTGVEKDNVQAYALISAAVDGAENPEQKQGMSDVLNKIGKDMTPDDITKAQELSKEWIAKRGQ